MTVSHTCDAVTATSTLLSTFLGNPSGYTMVLQPSINGVDKDPRTIESGDVTVDTIDINPSDFGLTEWETSVYGIRLSLTPTGGSEQYEEYCFFSDCSDLLCTVHEYQIDNSASKVRNLYDALIDLEACGDCDCTYMVKAYSLLLAELNSTSETEDCGC